MAGFLDSIGSFFQNDIAQPVENFVNNDIVQPVEQSAINTGQAFENLAQNLPQPVQQAAINTGNGASQTLDNLTNMGRQANSALGAVQNFIQHGEVNASAPVGNWTTTHPDMFNNPITAGATMGYNMFAAPVINLAGNTALDAARSLDNLAQGNFSAAANYTNLKSPVSRLAYQTMFGGSPLQQPTQTKMSPQETLANLGQLGQAVAPLIPGVGEGAGAEDAASKLATEALSGAGQMGAYGVASGLADGRDQSLPQQLTNAGVQGALGAVGGGAAGVVLPAAAEAIGKATPAIRDAIGSLVEKYRQSPFADERGFINPDLFTGGRGAKPTTPSEVEYGGVKFAVPSGTDTTQPLIYHGGQSNFDTVKSRGVMTGQNQNFGPGVYFTDGTETASNFSSDLGKTGGQNPNYAVPLNDFNLLHLDGSPEAVAKQLGGPTATPKDLPTLVAKQGSYDGFVITNPDSRVGNTYVITNTDKLNTINQGASSASQALEAAKAGAETPVGNEPPGGSEAPRQAQPMRFPLGGGKQDILDTYSGALNARVVEGNQIAHQIDKLAPNEQKAITWYTDAGGDTALLQKWANDPDPKLDPYRQDIIQATHLSPEGQQAAQLVKQYYDQTGQQMLENDVIHNIRENYINRIYDKTNPEGGRVGLIQTTSHAKTRQFDTLYDAITHDMTPTTTKASDLLATHNAEMAKVLTNRNFVAGLEASGKGRWVQPDNIPDGWVKYANLQRDVPIKDATGNAVIGKDGNQVVNHSVFVVPQEVAKGTKAITDPNFLNKVDSFQTANRFLSLLKESKLSASVYHHITVLSQTADNNLAGFGLPRAIAFAKGNDMQAVERDFAMHTGMTKNVSPNVDIGKDLVAHDGLLSKVENLPGVKQYKAVTDRSNSFLFDDMVHNLKLMDYGNKVDAWTKAHPDATPTAITQAKRGFAKEVNAAYGGMNWTSMGITPTVRGALRLTLLAPDWVLSNANMIKMALPLSQKLGVESTAAWAARKNIFTGLLGTALATEGLNHLITGHFTDQNQPGHQAEVEVMPGVYINLFRGGIGEAVNLASKIDSQGPSGLATYLHGKLNPVTSTAMGLMANTNGVGQPITSTKQSVLDNTKSAAAYVGGELAPVPFGVGNLATLVKDKTFNPASAALVATGIAKPGKPSASAQPGIIGTASAAGNPATPQYLSPSDKQAIKDQLTQLRGQYKQNAELKTPQGDAKAQEIQGQINQLEQKLSFASLENKTISLGHAGGANQLTTSQDQLTTALRAKQAQSEGAKIVRQVQDGTLTSDQGAQLLQQLGLDPQQTKYAVASTLPDGQKAQFANAQLNSTQDPAQLSTITKNLIDAKVLTAPVIAQMYQQGLISLGEANSLGKLVKAANPSLATLTKGLNAKPKKGRAAKAPKVGKVSTGKTTLLSGKASSGKSLGISGAKALKAPTISAPKVKVPKVDATTTLKTPAFKVPKVKVRIGKM